MNMKLRNIPFSPPDMTEAEAKEVREAILSGWITTGPRTKKLETLLGNPILRSIVVHFLPFIRSIISFRSLSEHLRPK